MSNLSDGIAAYKANDRQTARRLLIAAVKEEPNSERAWGWLYNAAETDKERKDCLRQMIRINPENEKARQALDKLNGTISSQSPAPTAKRETRSAPKKQKKSIVVILSLIVISVSGLFIVILAGITIADFSTQYSCQKKTSQYVEQIRPLIDEFDDDVAIANTTPRNSLGAIVQDMQRIKREMSDIAPPDCAQRAAGLLVGGVDQIIDGYLSFAGDQDDKVVAMQIRQGSYDAKNAIAQLDAISAGNVTPTPERPPTTVPEPTLRPFPTPMSEGSVIVLEDTLGTKWKIEVLSIETTDAIESNDTVEKAQGRFAILNLLVTNVGLSQATFYGFDVFVLADEKGRIFDASAYAAALLFDWEETLSCTDINPDVSTECRVVMDISKDSDLYILAPTLLSDPYQPSMVIRIPREP